MNVLSEGPKRVPHRSAGNPLWPLPPDYDELTVDGQRAARINACMQYRFHWGPRGSSQAEYQESLHKRALVFVDCLNFFDRYYLWPDEEANHDPMFYDQVVEPCALHYQISYESFVNRALMQMLPRGLAKSTRKLVEIGFKSLTLYPYSVIYTTSTHDIAMAQGERLRMQYKFNRRIVEDFGDLVPKKGDGSFNSRRMRLTNGFTGFFTSIESKQRGFRPMEYVLDDVEDDEKQNTDMEKVRAELDSTITKVIGPMLRRPNVRFHMMLTPISMQHLGARMAADILGLTLGDEFANHPSRKWTRIAHPILDENGRSVWPSLYPTDEAEKVRLGLHPETETLADIETSIGSVAYASEYLLKPGRLDAEFFKIDPVFNTYKVDGDPWWLDTETPLSRTDATLVFRRKKDDTERRIKVADLVNGRGTFMTVDSSYGSGPTSDWKVWHVLCRTHEGDILSLDMGAYKCTGPVFIREILEAADRWKCHTIYPEYVVSQREFCSTLENTAGEALSRNLGLDHVPRVKRLSVHNEPKASRIQSLGSWMDAGLIKLPADRVKVAGPSDPYRHLENQIRSFNPQARDGGLANDDHVDTLAAGIRTPKTAFEKEPDPDEIDEYEAILEAYLNGEDTWKGFPIAELVPFGVLYQWSEAREPKQDPDTGYDGTAA